MSEEDDSKDESSNSEPDIESQPVYGQKGDEEEEDG